MNENLQIDCDLSHAIINYLNALYRGKLAAYNALKQLSHRSFNQDEFARIQRSIETIQRWQQDLWKRMPLISARWKMPETFEAKRAFDLLKESKNDLTTAADRFDQILAADEARRASEDLELLVSGYIRFAYGKDNYLKGFVEYGQAFGRDELIESYSRLLQQSGQELHQANWLLKEFRRRDQIKSEYELAFHTATYLLPQNLRMNINDINHYLAIYDDEFGYDNAGISRVESQRWLQAGIEPKEAGYWAAFNFTAEDAVTWRSCGINDAALAGRWRKSGFTVESAADWQAIDFTPEIAGRWNKAGYQLNEAAAARKAGQPLPQRTSDKSN